MEDQNQPTIFMLSSLDLSQPRARGDIVHLRSLHDELNNRTDAYLFGYNKTKTDDIDDEMIIPYPGYSIPIKYLRTVWAQLVNLIFVLYKSIKLKPDVFYIRLPHLWIYPAIASKLAGGPIILEVNGILTQEAAIMEESYARILVISIVSRIHYWLADEIICVTPIIANHIIENYGVNEESVHVISNGVDIEKFQPTRKCPNRNQLGIPKNNKVIIFVGNLVKWQGVDYLLQAIPSIRQEIDNLSVIIVGDGPMKSELERLSTNLEIGDIVKFEGSVPHQQVPTYINSADLCVVYLIPLAASHSPLKLFEYMACGKPVVASRVSGFEFLEEIDAGILVPPKQPEALASEISALLSDDKRLSSLGAKGVNYVRENHTWEGVAEQVAEVIHRTR